MNSSTLIIIGMGTATVGSFILEMIMNSMGKTSEAQMVNMTTKGLLATSAIVTFAKVVKALSSL